MEREVEVIAGNVVRNMSATIAYGGKIATTFQKYSLTTGARFGGLSYNNTHDNVAMRIQVTCTALSELLLLLRADEAASDDDLNSRLFSEAGREYASVLTTESAATLLRFIAVIEEECALKTRSKKERRSQRAGRRKGKHIVPKKETKDKTAIDFTALELDVETLLRNMDLVNLSSYNNKMEGKLIKVSNRLAEIQYLIALITQVVTLGSLSRDLSAGQVDVKDLTLRYNDIQNVAFHAGIRTPDGPLCHYPPLAIYSDTYDSESASYSDGSAVIEVRPSRRRSYTRGNPIIIERRRTPSPPPLASVKVEEVLDTPQSSIVIPKRGREKPSRSGSLGEGSKPPAYSESGRNTTVNLAKDSKEAEYASDMECQAAPMEEIKNAKSHKLSQNTEPIYNDVPEIIDGINSPEPTIEADTKTKSLVKKDIFGKPPGYMYRFSNIFRTNEYLIAELKKNLSETQTTLSAYTIHQNQATRIPHSTSRPIEETHIKAIYAQSGTNAWYHSYQTLSANEVRVLNNILKQNVNGQVHEQEIVVLKKLQNSGSSAADGSGRVFLAILRGKAVGKKPAAGVTTGTGQSSSKTALTPRGPVLSPYVRPPFLQPPAIRSRVSDLKDAEPHLRSGVTKNVGRGADNSRRTPAYQIEPLPIQEISPRISPNPPLGRPAISVNIQEARILTDYDAILALTSYNTYTFRPFESNDPHDPRSWQRVAVTKELIAQDVILQKVQAFEDSGATALDTKLRLTEHQAGQVTRHLDDLKSFEFDISFEWTLVEISLYKDKGVKIDMMSPSMEDPDSAQIMNIVVKRSPKIHCNPQILYNRLMAQQNQRRPPSPVRPRSPPPVIRTRRDKTRRSRNVVYRSGSDSWDETDYWSSDDSWAGGRRRARHHRARKNRIYYHSDNENHPDDKKRDAIDFELQIRKGDNLVEALLDLWTAGKEIKEAAKAKA